MPSTGAKLILLGYFDAEENETETNDGNQTQTTNEVKPKNEIQSQDNFEQDNENPVASFSDVFIQEVTEEKPKPHSKLEPQTKPQRADISSPISQHSHSTTSDKTPKSPKTRPVPNHIIGELPQGWEARSTEEGQIFFIDHNSKSTTLLHPSTKRVITSPPTSPTTSPKTSPISPNSPRQNTKPLPLGWEMNFDNMGRPYFINHFSKTTTYKDPRLELLTTQPLPPGYEMRIDTQGIPYFVNHHTKTVSYIDPRN